MHIHPHTSKMIMLVLVSAATLSAGPLGIGVGANGGLAGINAGTIGHPLSVGANGFVHGDAHAGGGSVASGSSFNNMNALIGSAGYTTATDTIVDTDSFQTIGMRQSALADAHAAATVAKTLAVQTAGDHSAVAAASIASSPAIAQASVDDRDTLAADLNARMKANDAALAKAKVQAKALKADQRAEFTAALNDSNAREKTLKADVKAVHRASAANWTEARAKVATDYDLYAQAAQHATAVAAGDVNESSSATTAGTANAHAVANAASGSRAATKAPTAGAQAQTQTSGAMNATSSEASSQATLTGKMASSADPNAVAAGGSKL